MKFLLNIFKDVGLLVLLALLLVGGIYGSRMPYRNSFLGSGDYQFEVFETGVGIYQYDRVSPFYTISPMNDYVINGDGVRSALIESGEGDKETLITSFDEPKYIQMRDRLLTFFGLSNPELSVNSRKYSLTYSMELLDDGWVRIERVLNMIDKTATESAITVKLNVSDKVEIKDGNVIITNYTIPGSLVFRAGELGQQVKLNPEAQLVEFISPVGSMNETNVIYIKGETEGGI